MSSEKTSEVEETNEPAILSLKGELLEGVPQIADFIGKTPRQTYHLLSRGLIPGAFKIGAVWHARRAAILAGIRRMEQGAA